jgi:hypothetical protein
MTAMATPRGATVVTIYASPQCPLCQATDGTEPAFFAFPPTGADDPHALVIMFMSCELCDAKSRQADAAELKTISKRLSRYFDNWLITEKVPRLLAQSNGKRATA